MEENNALLNLARTTLLIAYTPLGLILCISRFFLAINACILLSILPEEFIVSRLIRRVTSVVLGMYVKRENFACRVQNTRVFVAYRDTNLAHIVSRIAFPVMILDTKQLIMGWLFGQVSCAESTSLRYEAEKILNKRIEVRPVMNLAKENKKFLFEEWPFFLHQAIHPISITTYNPLLPSYIKLPSSSLLDLIFLFFFPLTIMTVRIYPSMRREQQEMTQEFRRRIEGYLEEVISNPFRPSPVQRRSSQPRNPMRQDTLPSSKNDRDVVLAERKLQLVNSNLRMYKEKYGDSDM
eukprot:TRINITY_DN3748_c0_g2_i1.p1 TRINITY_DN3748_c0_g2~~TRINITY_DN3748_c0_g2_i1.p1  ORF type:complete len:294 (+),score=49.85 TRINITY_DN3748_c0_g2_i1:203-1084(+)